MSFWNSRQVEKTRKKHSCIFCQSVIPVGSSCRHETGTWEGEFNDYYLCNRCIKFIDKCNIDLSEGFSEGDFYECARYSDLFGACPICKSNRIYENEWSENSLEVEIECECGVKRNVDFSMGFDEFGKEHRK